MTIQSINKVAGLFLILLSIMVVIPLTIKTFQTGGGAWGFGIIGLPVLLPLSGYLLFGIAGVIRQELKQRRAFVAAHAITLVVGAICLYILPIYPLVLTLIPIILATLGITYRRQYKYYLLLMIALAVIANVLLLKWELDFGRAIPLFQLFEPSKGVNP